MIKTHPRAGERALPDDCINVDQLINKYYTNKPNINDPLQRVCFGTSGHRGSSTKGNFNQDHLLAIAQAIADIRCLYGATSCCFIGKDTHALSEPAFYSVLEVLTANNIPVVIQKDKGSTPTPLVSHAILKHNLLHGALADGIIITPSHNPPQDGGIKYNGVHAGPVNNKIAQHIERRANHLLANRLRGVKRHSIAQAKQNSLIHCDDFVQPYVIDLINVVDMQAIQRSKLKLVVDLLGSAGIACWQRIAEYYKIELDLINTNLDPTFSFMALDSDGVIRMDCSSAHTMRPTVSICQAFDLGLANDTDNDRHAIITQDGLMESNQYLTTAIDYLLRHRTAWKPSMAIGKTTVSSTIIDKIVHHNQRTLTEVTVGFKGFVNDFIQGKLSFACEESAGANFVRFNGQPWSTDKDGITLCLLAAEITAITQLNPQKYYEKMIQQLGYITHYKKLQRSISPKQQKNLKAAITKTLPIGSTLAGFPITARLTGDSHISFNGIKIMSDAGWFAIRPSGTEALCKIYCESFIDKMHQKRIQQDALKILTYLLSEAN